MQNNKNMETPKLIISPKTKILQIIEAYPQLEEVLIDYVPAFEKLKNPVLRKTVARIATVQQAATIGNVKIEDLINTLRKEIGQDEFNMAEETQYNWTQPVWHQPELIVKQFDIRDMLNAGEQPVNQVISDLNGLGSNEIYEVIAPFIPAPLIDKAMSLKIEHWVEKKDAESFFVYFRKI